MLTSLSNRAFSWIHNNNLIYNTCWEDPRLDRIALNIGAGDTVMTITSAGCNTLDYACLGPRKVHAVDMNPRQNALLELKIAGIRTLDYEDFFALFGRGWHEDFQDRYSNGMRSALPGYARAYWDKNTAVFDGRKTWSGLYYHGTCGLFARLLNVYLNRRPGLRHGINAILDTQSVDEQRDIYYGGLRDLFWNRYLRWFANRDVTLAMVGVPKAQRRQIEEYFTGGIAQFIEECLEAVFAWLPLGDNYFWRVYLTGGYTAACCPEYLKRENFEALRDGLVDRVVTHTGTVESVLRSLEEPVSRFVLLDHMDWLAGGRKDLLQAEWQAIADNAAPDARLIWRSGGLQVDYVDPLEVRMGGETVQLGEVLTYHPDLAADLHKRDRVHTYGSFYIADLATA